MPRCRARERCLSCSSTRVLICCCCCSLMRATRTASSVPFPDRLTAEQGGPLDQTPSNATDGRARQQHRRACVRAYRRDGRGDKTKGAKGRRWLARSYGGVKLLCVRLGLYLQHIGTGPASNWPVTAGTGSARAVHMLARARPTGQYRVVTRGKKKRRQEGGMIGSQQMARRGAAQHAFVHLQTPCRAAPNPPPPFTSLQHPRAAAAAAVPVVFVVVKPDMACRAAHGLDRLTAVV